LFSYNKKSNNSFSIAVGELVGKFKQKYDRNALQ